MKFQFAAFLAALLTLLTSSAQAEDVRSRLSGDVYSQSLWRPETRLDRSRGFFHETRVRGSYDVQPSSRTWLKLDVGSYLLGEWAVGAADQALPQNLAVSPYLGARLGEQLSGQNWIFTGTAVFEGRLREPLSDGARASGVKGWDPRTSAVLGFWWMQEGSGLANPFVDVYADAVLAPKFSQSLMSTLILRAGGRRLFGRDFIDAYAEMFSQNTPTLELGTKRSEARVGMAIGRQLSGGSAQLRLWHGFPIDAIQGSVLDQRSRTEALLILGFAL